MKAMHIGHIVVQHSRIDHKPWAFSLYWGMMRVYTCPEGNHLWAATTFVPPTPLPLHLVNKLGAETTVGVLLYGPAESRSGNHYVEPFLKDRILLAKGLTAIPVEVAAITGEGVVLAKYREYHPFPHDAFLRASEIIRIHGAPERTCAFHHAQKIDSKAVWRQGRLCFRPTSWPRIYTTKQPQVKEVTEVYNHRLTALGKAKIFCRAYRWGLLGGIIPSGEILLRVESPDHPLLEIVFRSPMEFYHPTPNGGD